MAQNNGHNFSIAGARNIAVPDVRAARGGSHPVSAAALAAMNDTGTMRTYLAAQAPSTYTSAMLDSMTENDMVYAIRCLAGGGLSSVAPAGIR